MENTDPSIISIVLIETLVGEERDLIPFKVLRQFTFRDVADQYSASPDVYYRAMQPDPNGIGLLEWLKQHGYIKELDIRTIKLTSSTLAQENQPFMLRVKFSPASDA